MQFPGREYRSKCPNNTNDNIRFLIFIIAKLTKLNNFFDITGMIFI